VSIVTTYSRVFDFLSNLKKILFLTLILFLASIGTLTFCFDYNHSFFIKLYFLFLSDRRTVVRAYYAVYFGRKQSQDRKRRHREQITCYNTRTKGTYAAMCHSRKLSTRIILPQIYSLNSTGNSCSLSRVVASRSSRRMSSA